jgi:hypothetical protein
LVETETELISRVSYWIDDVCYKPNNKMGLRPRKRGCPTPFFSFSIIIIPGCSLFSLLFSEEGVPQHLQSHVIEDYHTTSFSIPIVYFSLQQPTTNDSYVTHFFEKEHTPLKEVRYQRPTKAQIGEVTTNRAEKIQKEVGVSCTSSC